MDLAKKNLAEEHQLYSCELINPDAETPAPLEGLVNLLLDLEIIHRTEAEANRENEANIPPANQTSTFLSLPYHDNRLLALPPAKNYSISDQAINNLVTPVNDQQNLPVTPAEQVVEKKLGESEYVISAFERLQELIVGPELTNYEQQIAHIERQLAAVEHQIYDPKKLSDLLLPLVAELLTRKVVESKEEIVKAIAPIIDKLIENKSEQDKVAMVSALAPLIAASIAKQISDSPEEIAQAIAPTMGKAIKEQIKLESDAMVDALYPVIGSTIAKYMAEAIREINDKVANTLSVEGIKRKIRAKMQGVSEAELIFQEAMPFTVPAIFLIDKNSGLVISEVQQSGNQRLESEMISGMLTAIRSFANECMAQPGNVSELNQIDYGNFKIVLEVAGYCYLAVVVQGEAPRWVYRKIQKALSIIVKDYGKPIELFDGDPATIPEQVNTILAELRDTSKKAGKRQTSNPYALPLACLVVLSIIGIPWGIYQYRHSVNRRIEAQVTQALASLPELAVYRLTVDVHGKNLKLSGKLPSGYLRSKAAQVAKLAAPQEKVDNEIIAVELPPDPVFAAAEVQRVTKVLNANGVAISAKYAAGKVTVEGTVSQVADAKKITTSFEQIPGVRSVTNTVQLKPLNLATKIYFEQSSAQVKADARDKINFIKSFLERYPKEELKIIGYSDPSGTIAENQQLALERAKAVRDALVAQGIDAKRMQVVGLAKRWQDVDLNQPLSSSRYVELQP